MGMSSIAEKSESWPSATAVERLTLFFGAGASTTGCGHLTNTDGNLDEISPCIAMAHAVLPSMVPLSSRDFSRISSDTHWATMAEPLENMTTSPWTRCDDDGVMGATFLATPISDASMAREPSSNRTLCSV